MMRFLTFIFLLIAFNAFSQGAFRRFGIGAQVFEPTGITVQMFNGYFINNSSSLVTCDVWELGVGQENVTGLLNDKKYASGDWEAGGVRIDLNYLHPLLTVQAPLVLQTYLGAGLQTGTRKYATATGSESNFSTGANFMIRVEWITHGIDRGPATWFFSIYSDIKFHADFSENFDYLSPVLGVRLRKGK